MTHATQDTREDRFARLGEGPFDLLILGGGITGAGAARDAALRGLRVALVDKGDWAQGTSSRSSKLVHGGLRYLETFQLGLVRESTAERAVQMRLAPHLVRPLEFLMPIYSDHKHGLGFINLGLWLYDSLALFRVPKRHRMLKGRRALTRQPNLRAEGLKGALTYFDAATDDARLTLENVLDAASLGAVTVSHARATRLLKDAAGRVTGAEITDVLGPGGRTVPVSAHLTLNTTGPWADDVLRLAKPEKTRLVRPTKGAHIVLRAERLPLQLAVALIHPRDGRPVFAIPWGAQVYVGTTDFDYQGDFDHPFCGEDDRAVLLEALSYYFPEAGITPADIVGTWCGLRPLIAPAEEMKASAVPREHVLIGDEAGGLLTMTGGKLTTYRLMAKELVDRAVKLLRRTGRLPRPANPCRTGSRPLPGAVGLTTGQTDLGALSARLEKEGLALPLARHLAGTYGVRAPGVLACGRDAEDREPICPTLPVIWAEVEHAVRFEQAARVEDVLARRTQLALRAPEAALEAAPEVASRMGALLGWDAARQAAEVAAFTTLVEGSLCCRRSSGAPAP